MKKTFGILKAPRYHLILPCTVNTTSSSNITYLFDCEKIETGKE